MTTTKKSVDAKAAAYMPTRGTCNELRNKPGSILRAVGKGGSIQLATLTELLDVSVRERVTS